MITTPLKTSRRTPVQSQTTMTCASADSVASPKIWNIRQLFHRILFFYNEIELGVGIDPGMALTLLPSSIGLDGDRTHDLPIVSRVLYR